MTGLSALHFAHSSAVFIREPTSLLMGGGQWTIEASGRRRGEWTKGCGRRCDVIMITLSCTIEYEIKK